MTNLIILDLKMKKRNKIINVFSILLFISLIQNILSDITQFNSTELEAYINFINKYDTINKDIKKYEKKMKKIRINFKLRNKYRDLKRLNEQIENKILNLQKKINETEFNKNTVSKDINKLLNEVNLLSKKYSRFEYKYKSYDEFKSKIYGYIKIFFVCFFSVVAILLIILIIVAIIMHRKGPKYYTLHEEISVKQDDIKKIPNIKIVNSNLSDKSEERNFKSNNNNNVNVPSKKKEEKL